MSISEKFEHSRKYSPEDREFFDKLALKYGLEQDEEFLIIKKTGGEIHIPKWHHVPLEGGGFINIEDLIQKRLAEGEEERT